MRDSEQTPYSKFIGASDAGDFFLTHVIWHNSLGSNQPETGVRRKADGKIVQDSFHLIQHGVCNFDFAEPLILRGLRKGWGANRISDFVERLAKRRRVRATVL